MKSFFHLIIVTRVVLNFACAESSAQTTKPGAFFRPAPAPSQQLPVDEIYPRGRTMMFSLYSVVSPQVERMKQDGFTMIGPYYGDQERSDVLGKAQASGLKCFYAVGKRVPFVGDRYTMPSDAELVAAAEETVNRVKDRREIAAWYLANEELRHWRKDEMHWLQVTTDAIRKNDPQRRPIMMYDPNHRDAAAMARTVKFLDFASKGMYANPSGFKDNRIWIRWGVEQEVEAIKQVRSSAIPISVLWMCKDPDDPAEDAMIPDWTRHDVYLSLVSGAKGIVLFSGWKGRKGFQRTFMKYYEGYAAAAKELTGPLNLSQVFLFGEKRSDLKVAITSGPKELRMEFHKATAKYPSMSHLDMAYGPDRYLFMVNSANDPVTVSVQGLPVEAIRMEDLAAGSAQTLRGGKLEMTLPRLGVKCLRFGPMTGGRR